MAKLLRYLKPIWWEVLIVMLLTALDAYLGLLLPDFMTKITAIMENPDYATGTDAMTGLIPLWGHNYITPTGDSVKDIWIVGGVMTGISFIALILSFFGSIMNKGSIIEMGTHKELLAKNGFYADLYNAQFLGNNPMAVRENETEQRHLDPNPAK